MMERLARLIVGPAMFLTAIAPIVVGRVSTVPYSTSLWRESPILAVGVMVAGVAWAVAGFVSRRLTSWLALVVTALAVVVAVHAWESMAELEDEIQYYDSVIVPAHGSLYDHVPGPTFSHYARWGPGIYFALLGVLLAWASVVKSWRAHRQRAPGHRQAHRPTEVSRQENR